MNEVRREPIKCTCKVNGEHCYLCLYGEEAARELDALAARVQAVERKTAGDYALELTGLRIECDSQRKLIPVLEKQLAEAQGTIAELRGKAVKDVSECVSLTNRLTQAEQQVARMREALQVLYDEQNDAPLENRRQQWQAAMTLASGALRETGAGKGA